MGVRELQKAIIEHEGLIVSTDTLLTYDLLLASDTIIKEYSLKPDFRHELNEILDEPEEWVNHYNSNHPDLSDNAMWLWIEDIYEYFNRIAPKGYYFGNQEGDGALFGWFREEEV